MSPSRPLRDREVGVPRAAGRYVASWAPAPFVPGLGFRPVLAETIMVNAVNG